VVACWRGKCSEDSSDGVACANDGATGWGRVPIWLLWLFELFIILAF